MYCGSSIIVRDAIHNAATKNIGNWMMLAAAAADANNHEEAYAYYTRILEVDPTVSQAWAGKAAAAGWMSTLASFRLPEMLSGFQKAIDCAAPERQIEVKQDAALQIHQIIDAYYRIARKHLYEFISVDNVWNDYLVQCDLMITGLETARRYWPEQQSILDYLIYIYRDNIHGVAYWDQYAPNGPVQRVKTLSPEYEAQLRSKLTFWETKKRELDPSYQPEEIKKATASGCFVVTAVMGSENDPIVHLLRDFRDRHLVKTSGGRHFIYRYYEYGPRLARLIEISQLRRLITRLFVVAPAVWLVRWYLKIISHN
jgi:tetratricopeptide (TPR) repeat protein